MSAALQAAPPAPRCTDRPDLAATLALPEPACTAALADLARRCPDWEQPLLALGARARAAGDAQAAADHYRAALARAPDHPAALLALGAILLSLGAPAQAEPPLHRCCTLAPTDANAHHAWGLALLLLGRPAPAFEALATAHALDPAHALCGVHLADAAHALSRSTPLLAALEAEMRAAPANAALMTARAACLAHLGRRAEALDLLEAATLIDPGQRVAAAIFADMLARTTRQIEAEPALRRALALDPANHDASMALSVVLMRLHRHAEAVAVLHDLLARGAPRLGPLCNLATALTALGRQTEAVAHAHEAIAAAPDHPAAHRALCNALPYLQGITGEALLGAARHCGKRQPRAALACCRTEPAPDRRLRLGLLSGTLRAHPVGWLTIAGFEHLDPADFELICLTPNQPEDALGHRFAARAASWEDTGSLDDRQLAERARALRLDIVIDLGGYGDFGRMPALASRLAPVQIKWVGMQNHSTGLAEMDWFVTDRWATPAGFERFYSERLLRLPDGYVCYTPPADAPDPAPSPGLQSGAITFGCFNNIAKITPVVVATWARILHAVPAARLVLKAHQFNNADTRAEITAAFAARAIAPDRLDLRGSSPHRALLEQYGHVDLVLDPFPYSGGLTTCEALWMGVPTLTMPGETFASRHSASHMSNVGLSDWIAPNPDAYLRQATERAADLPALARLRQGLRARMQASPLCDAARFGANLAAALRSTWHDWCHHQQSRPQHRRTDIYPLL